jgi:DNA repair photolyase
MLRLPLEIAPLFRAWLDEHFPLRAAHIMSLVQQVRGGHDYVSTFGERMRGTGAFADLIEKRFDLACKRLGPQQGSRRGIRHVALQAAARERPTGRVVLTVSW